LVTPANSLNVWNCCGPLIGTSQPTTGTPSPLEMLIAIVLFACAGAAWICGGGAAMGGGAATGMGIGAGCGFLRPSSAMMPMSTTRPPGIAIHSHHSEPPFD
jgi:hypothetical protein